MERYLLFIFVFVDKIEKLEAIIWWIWEVNVVFTWDEQLAHAVEQYTKLGKIPSSTSKDAEAKRTGGFINAHRTNKISYQVIKSKSLKS